ncbi:hypothetical protein ACQPYK_24435 [Streptosporangium sp. CA-135522]|uniref:hypothetical protein n=1 Tax=Streptosporangium sp. CA-135522 TaxID=3240072 RepID=UPI003D8A6DD1
MPLVPAYRGVLLACADGSPPAYVLLDVLIRLAETRAMTVFTEWAQPSPPFAA